MKRIKYIEFFLIGTGKTIKGYPVEEDDEEVIKYKALNIPAWEDSKLFRRSDDNKLAYFRLSNATRIVYDLSRNLPDWF